MLYPHNELRQIANGLHDAAPSVVEESAERLRAIADEIEPQTRQRFFRFTVKSSYPFPTDMLRYDRCWPADSETANMIALTLGPDQVKGIVTYRLECWSPFGPKRERWESFMFHVADVEEVVA